MPLNPGNSLGNCEPIDIILQAFVPHVTVVASEDTDALVKSKGFKHGLWQLLRPFGDRVHGKVTIRDSNGSSRSWEDFAIRFSRSEGPSEAPELITSSRPKSNTGNGFLEDSEASKSRLRYIDTVLNYHLQFAEASQGLNQCIDTSSLPTTTSSDETSPYYGLYLRRILSGLPQEPCTTFTHPVASVIAISSRNTAPIDELRRLYADTSEGARQLPAWVDGEYLRYYVLVHDEENDDISRSLSLFEQMKRHLGLHCHLLRLRSTQCAETDDDSVPLQPTMWLTAFEELDMAQAGDGEDELTHLPGYVFESDIMAIRAFVREMVTQSIIPTMERHVALWNENVASRRRGITGRLVNFSKKWTGFSSGSRSSASGPGLASGFETLGFYRPETHEATMRKLADFAFMLRDYKLAHSTYDLVRGDFFEAKAWKYHAAASEMAAVSLLLTPKHLVSKSRAEMVDQILESSFYSYHARCGDISGSLRCVTLCLELLKIRGGDGVDDAAKWAIRLIDSRLPSRIADVLLKERVAACYFSKPAVQGRVSGLRRRKAALWNILSAEAWIAQGRYVQAHKCLHQAQTVYFGQMFEGQIKQFGRACDYVTSIQAQLNLRVSSSHMDGACQGLPPSPVVDEESEALGDPLRRQRATTLTSTTTGASLETAPLRENLERNTSKDRLAQGAFG